MKKPDTALVDARLLRDYEQGHIERALSVPVDLPPEEQVSKLRAVARDAHIVLYCRSAKCPYARKVANVLRHEGYSNVCVYSGGWLEWLTRQEVQT